MNQTNAMGAKRIVVYALRRFAVVPIAALILLMLGLWNLSAPPMWWDEGWTLSVARNLVERGFYGRLLEDHPAPPGLEASPLVTASVGLSFRLFGVGVWQGRLFGVVCTLGALALIGYLAAHLYDRSVAIGTLAVLLLLSMHPQLHPLIQGRQVLAELPMLLFLMGGYTALLLALRRSGWFLLPAAACWGLGVFAKGQPLPFWIVSLLVPLSVALFRREGRLAAFLGAGLLGGIVVWRLLSFVWVLFLQQQELPATSVTGLYEVTALVLGSLNRWLAFTTGLTFGLLTLLGLIFAIWMFIRQRAAETDAAVRTVRLALFALSGSWFAWYLFLSVGVPRYLFPATFVGSIFAAVMLREWTNSFNVTYTLQQSGATLARLRFTHQSLGALAALVLITMGLALTSLAIQRYYFTYADDSAVRVAAFFNTGTPENTRIETYESELHFLLNRPYHYPPDQVHVELNRRGLLNQWNVAIDYDPLVANPDYLVVGEFSRGNNLYQPLIEAGAFRLMQSIGGYDIYQRVR